MQRNVREGRKVDTKDKKEYNRLSNIFFRTVKSPLLKTLKNKPKPPPKKINKVFLPGYSMLRTPFLSSITASEPGTNAKSRRIRELDAKIYRISSHCTRSEGREQKALFEIIHELKCERDAILEMKENNSDIR
jgi:hypothetical protein